MKTLLQIIVIPILFSSFPLHGEVEDRRLPMQSSKVDVEKTVWDFSLSEESVRTPLYRVYGDSLIAEVYAGGRQWYGLHNDSTFYLGEETRFYKTLVNEPIPTSAFNTPLLSGRIDYEAEGLYCKSFALGLDGNYESYYPVKGKLIIGEGHEFVADAVTECRRVVSWITTDTIPALLTKTQEFVRTRWFVAGDHLPIALQISETVLHDGHQISSETVTYCMRHDDIHKSEDDGREAINNAIANAQITVSGGIVRIEGDFPPDVELIMHVSNIAGSQFHQEPIGASFNGSLWEIPLPVLPPGQYILTISAGTPSNRKIPVTL